MVELGGGPDSFDGAYISLSHFFPTKDMALTFSARVFAKVGLRVRRFKVFVEYGHLKAVRFTRGVLCHPFLAPSKARWSRSIGMSTEEFFATYVPNISPVRSIRGVFSWWSDVLTVYMIHVIQEGGKPIGSYVARRVIDFSKNRVEHDILISRDVPDPVRRRIKYVAHMLDAALSFYEENEIDVIYMTAGLDSGGRLWPKYGFRPINSREWLNCRTQILENLRALPPAVQSEFGPIVEKKVGNPDPISLQSIYHLDGWVDDPRNPGVKRPLGVVLLTNTRWRGKLNLRDEESLQILKEAIRADKRAMVPR
jgi:ribosomal protein L30E